MKIRNIIAITTVALTISILIVYPAKAIKIGLHTHVKKAFVGVSESGLIVDARTKSNILVINPMKGYKVSKKGKYIVFSNKQRDHKILSNALIIRTVNSNGFVFTKDKWYKGQLIILNTKKGLTIINDVDLENYVMGVVPAEMPPVWNFEAHKAQAIAARSYALANKGKRSKYGYDLKDTPEDQAYKGVSGETSRTNRAVIATFGEVLIHNNKVISAYYHASAGGRTICAKRVWGNKVPFVKQVNSFDHNVPKSGHGVGMSQNGANMLANRGYSAYQILGYFYNNVRLRKMY